MRCPAPCRRSEEVHPCEEEAQHCGMGGASFVKYGFNTSLSSVTHTRLLVSSPLQVPPTQLLLPLQVSPLPSTSAPLPPCA